MEITNVKVKVMHTEGNLKAYATITFDDEFVVKDIKVIDGKKGVFIAMPSVSGYAFGRIKSLCKIIVGICHLLQGINYRLLSLP